MAESYKKLASIAPTNDDEYVLYRPPVFTESLLSNITVANRSSSSATFDINVYPIVPNIPAQPQTAQPNSLTSRNFVVVFNGGARVSTNGVTWTSASIPNQNWRSATCNNIFFVAVAGGPSAAAATSTDGITWTARTMPSSQAWRSVSFNSDTFVAIADGPSAAAATSTDGITWTASTMPSSRSWSDVTFGNNLFVAPSSGASNQLATSTNGISWTQRSIILPRNWFSAAYGNDVYIVVASSSGNQNVLVSTNGTTWVQNNNFGNIGSPQATFGQAKYTSPPVNNLYKTFEIDGNETLILEPGIALSDSSGITVRDNSSENLTFSIYGVELS